MPPSTLAVAPPRPVGARPDLIPSSLAAGVGLVAIVDAATFRLSAADQVVFAGFAAVIVGFALLVLAADGVRSQLAAGLAIYLGFVTLGFVPILLGEEVSWVHTVADALTFLAPAAILVIVAVHPEAILGRVPIGILLGSLGLAAFVAAFVGAQPGTNRHLPPATILIVSAWTAAWNGPSARIRGAGWAAVAATIALTIDGGNRTSVAIWAAAGVLVLYRRSGLFTIVGGGIIAATVVAGIVAFTGVDAAPTQVAENTRFAELVNGERDESTAARFSEGADVFDNMADWPAWQHLIGAGHGATWTPIRQSGFWEGDRYHAIHLGHVRTWYRYGLLGFIPVIAVLWIGLRVYRRSPRRPRTLAASVPLVVSISALLLAVDFAVRNPLTAATTSLTLGALAAIHFTPIPARAVASRSGEVSS